MTKVSNKTHERTKNRLQYGMTSRVIELSQGLGGGGGGRGRRVRLRGGDNPSTHSNVSPVANLYDITPISRSSHGKVSPLSDGSQLQLRHTESVFQV